MSGPPQERRVLVLGLGTTLLAWPAAVLAAPLAWGAHPLAWLAVVLLGLAPMLVLLSFLMHEAYHNHFFRSVAANRLVYWSCCVVLLLNPQLYALAHELHHGKVHTTEDWEFFPRGPWASPGAARRQLLLELAFGQIAWVVAVAPRTHAHPRHSWRRTLGFVALALLAHGALSLVAWRLHGPRYGVFFCSYGLALWASGVATRWLQFAEHLGVLAPAGTDLLTRVGMTRVVRVRGGLNRLWHWATWFDSENHAAHHAWPRTPSRRALPWSPARDPEVGIEIDARDVPGIVLAYWRDPAGVREGEP